jgi:hypothetical protein
VNSNVYTLPINRVEQKRPKSAFGELNLYRTATGEDDVERLLMQLETDTGSAFSEFKKTADAGTLSDDNAVQLVQKDVDTIKKFFIVATLRTTVSRNHMIDAEQNVPVMEYMLTKTGQKRREIWLDMLRHLLQTPFDELLAEEASIWGIRGKEDGLVKLIRDAVELCQTVSKMKLHVWKAPLGKEFLLGDPLVRIEGQSWAAGESRPQAAHLFMPISPTVVVVLCDETHCATRSMLSEEVHKPPKPGIMPAKKKPRSRGYKPPRDAWTYYVTECSAAHLFLLNGHILPSTRVVFRSRFAFDEARNSVLEFRTVFNTRRGSTPNPYHDSQAGLRQRHEELEGIGDTLLNGLDLCLQLLGTLQPVPPMDIMDGYHWVSYCLLSLKQPIHRFCPHCEEGLIGEFPESILERFKAAYADICDDLTGYNFPSEGAEF